MLLQTNQSTSQASTGWRWILPLTIYFLDLLGVVCPLSNPIFAQATQTGLYGPILASTEHVPSREIAFYFLFLPLEMREEWAGGSLGKV